VVVVKEEEEEEEEEVTMEHPTSSPRLRAVPLNNTLLGISYRLTYLWGKYGNLS